MPVGADDIVLKERADEDFVIVDGARRVVANGPLLAGAVGEVVTVVHTFALALAMLDLQFDTTACHSDGASQARSGSRRNPQHVFGPRSRDVGVVAAALVGRGTGHTMSREVSERAAALESCLGENARVAVVPVDADRALGTLVGVRQRNVGGPAIEKRQCVVNGSLGRSGGAFAIPVIRQMNV